ncbi:hypothetical protein V8J88_07630 [Massilia sp. W12]|uniref:hypothetical protein n=1 Tax=Massilia sp. W12 TaxID=3126507 RepID=UPI0030D417FD
MSIFVTLTTDLICSAIHAAKQHVILAAPGISTQISQALLQAWQRLPAGALQIVLDVSPNVARLGYGQHQAVQELAGAGLTLHQHTGLRIGVLICDDAGWTFASSPSLVEADPDGAGDGFNAIALSAEQIAALRMELPTAAPAPDAAEMPAAAIAAAATCPDQAANPVVGAKLLDAATLGKVKRALEIAPPQQFDLARQTQTYAALIQFVELSFEGFNIQSRRVQLPKSLPLIASKEQAVKDRLSASLKLLDKIEKPQALAQVSAKLEELRKAYLVPVGQAGRIILKAKRNEFEKELSQIEAVLAECKKTLADELDSTLQKVADALTPDLARAVLADPPPRFRGLFPLEERYAREFVQSELAKTLPRAEDLVANLKIHKYYKDVTYETLKNPEFSERVMSVIPASVLDGALLHENVVAQASPVLT